MAALAEGGWESEVCPNCRKEIPAANLTIHELHCRRHMGLCPLCQEAFPKAALGAHYDEEHAQVPCKCGMKMDRGLLAEHAASKCPLRPLACQHCGIELPFSKIHDHEDYCGARTERCSRCNRNVMLRDLKEHPADCGKKTEGVGVSQAGPCLNSEAGLRNIQTTQNTFRPDAAARSLPRTSRFLENRLYNCLSRDQRPREFGRRNTGPAQVDENQAVVLLSCEFCEELYPEEELIFHQTRCNPTSALASFSKRSSSPPHSEHLLGPWEQLKNNQTTGSIKTPPSQHDTYSSVMIPCEFCGILLEEEILFHHQDQCDFCSAPSPWVGRTRTQQRSPATNYMESTELLDLPQTHIQHQGKMSPQSVEECRQQKLPQSVQGGRSPSNLVTAQHTQMTSPDNRRENNIGPTKGGKPRGGVQTASWPPGDLPAAPMSTRRFHPDFSPSTYEPSFPETAPSRPSSLRSDDGRSPTRHTHYNNMEAEHLLGPWEQLQNNQTTGDRETPPSQHDTYSSVMLPCEFCGILLEEEILFHHQDQCDFCSAPTPWVGRTPTQQRTPATNYVERTELLDLPRTHIQQQGKMSPQSVEECRQQKLPQSVQGGRSPSNLVTAQHIQMTSPDNRRENNIGPTKGGKPRGGVQTASWPPGDLPAAPMSTRRFHPDFSPSTYEPSFPETAPSRPSSLRSEGGGSPTRRTHYNNKEAKPWQAEYNYSDDE